jgi:UDP-N-acetylglucosamine 2-epimerase (non-hydrolysing)
MREKLFCGGTAPMECLMKTCQTLVVFGTRPEAIKMAPVVRALRASSSFAVKVCITAQHRRMLDQVLSIFEIKPDFDLNLMKVNQELTNLTSNILLSISTVFRQWKPDVVLVQGDTTTTFAASLAAFYDKIPVAHVEAGLRTACRYSPWPEEIHRCLTSILATWHFAPTRGARQNLLAAGIDPRSVTVTGNTIVDALTYMVARLKGNSALAAFYKKQFSYLDASRRLVLVTGHRRENFGNPLNNICVALRELARRRDVQILYPVHLNPKVRRPVTAALGGRPNVFLIEPQEYLAFIYLLRRCYLILTDSGGIQEEAPTLGKPLLLMRDTTERPEAVQAGTVKLVGTDVQQIVETASRLLDDDALYEDMSRVTYLFGDGHASLRIRNYLEATLQGAFLDPRSISVSPNRGTGLNMSSEAVKRTVC